MNPIRSILITGFLAFFVFTCVVYTACHKDKCSNVNCANGGVCNGGDCLCPVGYEGATCEALSREKFIRTFNGHDLCNVSGLNRLHQYPLHFVSVPSKPQEFMLKDFIENPDDSATCTIRSADSFTFYGSNNSTVFSGYGTLRRDTMRLSYRIQHDTDAYTCTYMGL